VFVAIVTNQYKSSPAVAHGTRTNLGARFRLFTTIHSVAENENIRHFSLSCNYETYADRFLHLCEIKYLMSAFTSFKTSLLINPKSKVTSLKLELKTRV